MQMLLLLLAVVPQSNSNDVPLNNGADAFAIYSDPSVGSSHGTHPPDLASDLWWRGLPGDRILAHVTPSGTVEIDGYLEWVFDSDWSTAPWFHDRLEGPALASITNPGNLEPAFFQLGMTTEVLVSMGPTGLPNPWTPPDECPPFLTGYIVDVRFDVPPGSGILIPADGTGASDHATTVLLPGGMPYATAPGSCGIGDYVVQSALSLDETQADDLPGGISTFGGYQIAGGGPIPDLASEVSASVYPTFRDRMLNVLADSGGGFERAWNGGGATNALRISASSGTARISWELRSSQDVGIPNLAVAAASLTPLALPGASVLGAALLVSPDPVFLVTSGLTIASGVVVTDMDGEVYVFPEGLADFESPWFGNSVLVGLPAAAIGLDLYSQGLVLHTASLQGHHTNRVRTSLYP